MSKFKVGDVIEVVSGENVLGRPANLTVRLVDGSGDYWFDEIRGSISKRYQDVYKLVSSNRHKHYYLILAWAEGKTIQASVDGKWYDTVQPHFDLNTKYRVKPSELFRAELALLKAKEDLANAKALVQKLESQT
jgi:hypothetical protein